MSTTKEFKKGDRVRICKDSQYYGNQSSADGTITYASGENYNVKFDDGYSNGYEDEDLEFCKPTKEFKKIQFKGKLSITDHIKNILKTEKDKDRIKALRTFQNCILPEKVRCTIEECITIVLRRDVFEAWGINDNFEKGLTNSILLYGPPGTGKTMVSESIASVLGQNLMRVDNSMVQSNVPGKTEKNISQIFKDATSQNAVIMLDECDSILYNRDAVGMIMSAEINHFLQEIERFDGVIILTTNRLHKLDSALQRRIIAKVELPMPTEEARKQIWMKLIPKKMPTAKINITKLAKAEISGGDIKNAILLAARKAIAENVSKVTQVHFDAGLESVLEAKENYAKCKPKTYREAVEEMSVSAGNNKKDQMKQIAEMGRAFG